MTSLTLYNVAHGTIAAELHQPLEMVRRLIRRRRRARPTRLPFKRRYRTKRSSRMRRRFVRKRRTGILHIKVVWNFNVTTTPSEVTNVSVAPSFVQFSELEGFANQFEAYRFHWFKVKVTPYCNISSWDGQIGPYVSASYKKPFDATKVNPDTLMSIDNSRQYHGNSTSNRSFVPAIHMEAGANNGTTASVIRWRPRIEIKDNFSTQVPHYCGIYSFPPASTDAETKEVAIVTYWFRVEGMVTLYNQKLNF